MRRNVEDAIRNGDVVGTPPKAIGPGGDRIDNHGAQRPVGDTGRR
ncbi:hypothetical protein [Methylobacterium sp. J-088]|nr:hypothetical protein [Methylobacterium sp. J-088]